MDYYSTSKRKEILTHTMKTEDRMLNYLSWPQKDKFPYDSNYMQLLE